MRTDKKVGKSLAERVQKLQAKMGSVTGLVRDWSEVKLPLSAAEGPSNQRIVGEGGKYAEMNKVLREMVSVIVIMFQWIHCSCS